MKNSNSKTSRWRKQMVLKPLVLAMALPGAAIAAENCDNIDPWAASDVYVAADQVVHSSNLYEAKWWTRGADPTQAPNEWYVWFEVASCEAP